MTPTENIDIAHAFLGALGPDLDVDQVLGMFAANVEFLIPGDPAAFPWLGRPSGRWGLESLLYGLKHLVVHDRLEISDIVAGSDRAVILGSLASRFVSTGRLVETPFAIVLKVEAGRISNFLMLEDSFAVSNAARPRKVETSLLGV